MTEDKIKGLFGGGEATTQPQMTRQEQREMERQQRRAERRAARLRDADEVAKAQDFINRYSTGSPTEGYSSDEAIDYLRQLRGEASPEEWRRATAAAVQNLPEDQRKQFNQMLQQRRAGTGMVTIDRTGDARAAESRGAGQSPDMGDMGLDDLVGGLFGGLMGGAMATPDQPSNAPSGGPDMGSLGDMFGSLFGGGGDEQPQQQAPQQEQQGGQGDPGGIGDILQNPLGKAVLGGIAAFALKELIDKQNRS